MYEIIKNADGVDICVCKSDNVQNIYIPIDPENVDYQAYLAWLAANNQGTVTE
jgi:hypothetical protein